MAAGRAVVSPDGPAPVEAQVLFADCRAPGPISASIGWKVKDYVEAPGSTPVRRTLLQAVDAVGQGYVPNVDVAVADRSAAAAPVLKQVRLEGDVMLLAQFADAGLDRTGRASHTMHGLLHSAPLRDATQHYRRPLELFDSPMWLRPVGTEAIEVASVKQSRFDLPVGPVGLGEVIGDAFLTDLDRPERVALLPVVLEAFRTALADDATSVFVVADPTESAQWFALLSNLVDPVSAGTLRFSTREDLLSVSAVDGWDYHLAAVVRPTSSRGARDPLASLSSRFLLVDTGQPPVENADGTWTLADGSDLRRSAWTELAETVLMSPVVTGGVRNRLDQLAAEVAGIDAEPTWGLPVAAMLAGADLPDTDHAVRWIFEHWPAKAEIGPDLVDELGATLSRAIGESDSLSAELSGSVGPGVPDFLADAVIAGAVRRALADLRPGADEPALGRPLSAAAADSLAAELPSLLGWLDREPLAARLAVTLRVVKFGTRAGLTTHQLREALRPSVDAVVRAIVDLEFDPRAHGLPPLRPEIWREFFRDAVSDALSVQDPAAEVSPATHEWLTPSLGRSDQPETAARRRDLVLTGYGNRRAAWRGGSPDPWQSAVFAVGMMHVNTFRFGMPSDIAARQAMQRAFAGLPIPVMVAERILDVVDADQVGARLAIAAAALSDGEFRPEQQQFAQTLRRDAGGPQDPMSPAIAPVYLHLLHDRLVRGDPATAIDPVNQRAAAYIAPRLGELSSPVLRAAARVMLLGWGMRLPVHAVRGPNGPPPDDAVDATLTAIVPESDQVELAFANLLRQDDNAVLAVLPHVMVRAGLALFDTPAAAAHDPYARYLGRRDDKDSPAILRGLAATWLADRGKPAYAELSRGWDRVIDALAVRGWQARARDLEEDKVELVDALQSRSILSRRRTRR